MCRLCPHLCPKRHLLLAAGSDCYVARMASEMGVSDSRQGADGGLFCHGRPPVGWRTPCLIDQGTETRPEGPKCSVGRSRARAT